jgi:hypothetical protein
MLGRGEGTWIGAGGTPNVSIYHLRVNGHRAEVVVNTKDKMLITVYKLRKSKRRGAEVRKRARSKNGGTAPKRKEDRIARQKRNRTWR